MLHGRSHPQTGSRGARVALAAIGAVLVLCAAGWARQPELTLPGERPDLTAQRLPVDVIDGRLEFGAMRVDSWSEGDVIRLLLTGDARVALGVHEFDAARAVVWLAPLPAGDPEGAPGVYQVFVYFDRVGTPTEDAAIAVTADRLSVQGIFRPAGPIVLKADLRREGRPADPLVREGERRLDAYLHRLATGTPEPEAAPGPTRARPVEDVMRPGVSRPYAAGLEPETAAKIADVEGRLEPSTPEQPIFAAGGIFTVASGDVTATAGEEENTLTIVRGVTVIFQDRDGRVLQLTAESAVIFLDPGPLSDFAQFDVADVRGVYLEGDVIADDGRYRLRAPKVFYSVQENRAYLVDAVFWTMDERRGQPLYVRAKAIEQHAADTFKATGARLTNTAFFDADLSLGVSSVTITRKDKGDGEGKRTIVDAHDITVRAGGLPVFYFPRFHGDPAAIPIKGVGIESSSGSGAALKTTWNAFSLLGIDPPSGHSLDLLVDYYFERGPAVGAEWDWNRPGNTGKVFAYTLPSDSGKDVTSTRARIDHDGDFRGIFLAENTVKVSDHWTLQLQGSYISDETFADAFFERMARTRREFETSAYAKRVEDSTILTLEAKTSLNDFIANEYLVQSPGFTVERLPEATYTRLADDVLPSVEPGLLTWSSEYRLGWIAMNFHEPTAAETGFTRPGQSSAFFGITPNQSIAQALRARGYTGEGLVRFDTRQELSLQGHAGPVNVTPFVVGRLTTWDGADFTAFSPNADEDYRAWGAAGVRLATEFQRVDNDVESRLFDLHRIRHIVSPSVTIWGASTTINREDLPVYDESVEGIEDGVAVRFAVEQVWQTQRGGPGRWRSVDVFKLNTEIVISDRDETDQESPIGRFFDHRPELSVLGDFAGIEGVWQVSEAVALAANTVFDLNIGQQARSSVGAAIQHSPEFSTFGDIRYINSQNQTYAIFGARYELTPKYDFSGNATYDTDRGDIQYVSLEIRRALRNVYLGIAVSYNDVSGETGIGFIIQPAGLMGRGFGLGSGRDDSSFFGN